VIPPGERTRRRPRGARPPVWLVALVAAAVVFVAGIALGMALHDNPKPDLTVTTTKTIVP
jgi:type VI protein secretion system component VasF